MEKIKLFEELREKSDWANVPSGYIKACKAYFDAQDHKSLGPVNNDVLFDREIADFAKAMKDAGVKTIYISCQSTGLIDILFLFQQEGIKMKSVCEIPWVETYHPDNKVRAIEMIVE